MSCPMFVSGLVEIFSPSKEHFKTSASELPAGDEEDDACPTKGSGGACSRTGDSADKPNDAVRLVNVSFSEGREREKTREYDQGEESGNDGACSQGFDVLRCRLALCPNEAYLFFFRGVAVLGE